nr:LON peptidase substrate-binding domain-containing protein [uncultured Gellertiella sp.]
MQVGNARYLKREDIPSIIPVFPLTGALLLPGGQLPLNVFEPRYLMMFDDALASNRVIGMIQPAFGERGQDGGICEVGCVGRITSIAETGDGRYMVTLSGICRFRVAGEVTSDRPYRMIEIMPFLSDLKVAAEEETIDRAALLTAFKAYLDSNKLEADWESVERASNITLVTSLSMMSPFGPAEKQALLEAPDMKTRAETLIAITEIVLARTFGDSDTVMQ